MWWLAACDANDLPPATCPTEHAVVSTLRFGRLEDGVTPGFDLDGVDGSDGDVGCDKDDAVDPDGAPGIDNAFASLLPVLEATEAAALEPLIQDFVNNGTILLVPQMDAFGAEDDPTCRAWRVWTGDDAPLVGTDGLLLPGQTLHLADVPADPVPATIDDRGRFRADGFGFDLDIQIFDATVHLPIRGASVAVTRVDDDNFTAVLGGGFAVQAILDSLLGTGIDAALQDMLPAVLDAAADLDHDGDGTCESLSVSLETDLVSVWVYEPAG